MTEYLFNPESLDHSKIDAVVARNAEEMAVLLFTALFARIRYMDMRPFTEEDLREEIGDRTYDAMAKKALGWLAQL